MLTEWKGAQVMGNALAGIFVGAPQRTGLARRLGVGTQRRRQRRKGLGAGGGGKAPPLGAFALLGSALFAAPVVYYLVGGEEAKKRIDELKGKLPERWKARLGMNDAEA